MRTARQIINLILALLGVALVVRGVWGGVWPPTLQLLAGVLLIVWAALQLRFR